MWNQISFKGNSENVKKGNFIENLRIHQWYFHLIMNQICRQCGKATKAIEELGESLIMRPLCWKQENVWRPIKKCTKGRKDNRNQ